MRELIFLGTLFGIYLPVIISPGPNFIVVSKAAVSESRRHGIYTAFGISSGTLIWASLAATGVGLLFAHFIWARRALQVLGGAYLLYMGFKTGWHARRPLVRQSSDRAQRSLAQAYRRGLSTSLTNPQSLAFFTSVFATLLAPDLRPWAKLAGIGLVTAVSIMVYLAQATLFSSARVQHGYGQAKTWIDGFSGGLLALLGTRLLLG